MRRMALVVFWGMMAAGCTSHTDFTYPTIHSPFVSKAEIGKPYIEGAMTLAQRRAERWAQILEVWRTMPHPQPIEYRMGINDVIEVNYLFFAAADFSDRVITIKRTIPEDGILNLPWTGDVQVTGLTLRELEEKIRTAGARFVKAPQVAANVLEYRSTGVFVTGGVGKPGVYYLAGNRNTVLDLVQSAGGLQWGGQGGGGGGGGVTGAELPDVLYVFRGGVGVRTALFHDASPGGAKKETNGGAAPPGKASDSPGKLAPEQKKTVGELVREYDRQQEVAGAKPSGPPKKAAEDLAAVFPGLDLKPPGPGSGPRTLTGQKAIVVDLRQLMEEGNLVYNIELVNGDVVVVPQVINKYVYVQGYVNGPGQFVMTEGMQLDVIRAVGMAGGLMTTARADNAYLLRPTDEGMKQYKLDLIKIYQGVRPTVYLQTGDTLVVGTNWWIRMMEAMSPAMSGAWDKNLKYVGGGGGIGFIK